MDFSRQSILPARFLCLPGQRAGPRARPNGRGLQQTPHQDAADEQGRQPAPAAHQQGAPVRCQPLGKALRPNCQPSSRVRASPNRGISRLEVMKSSSSKMFLPNRVRFRPGAERQADRDAPRHHQGGDQAAGRPPRPAQALADEALQVLQQGDGRGERRHHQQGEEDHRQPLAEGQLLEHRRHGHEGEARARGGIYCRSPPAPGRSSGPPARRSGSPAAPPRGWSGPPLRWRAGRRHRWCGCPGQWRGRRRPAPWRPAPRTCRAC